MVERIRITPTQILARDAGGNITFNTDYAYLKTGSGTSYVGGYQRAPAIYGTAGTGVSIIDHAEYGGYVSDIKSGETFYPQQTSTHYWYVPKSNQVTFKLLPAGATVTQAEFTSPYWRTVQYYNADTYGYSDTYISYKWAIGQFGFDIGDDGQGSTTFSRVEWQVYPVFNTNNFPAVTNPSGGAFALSYSANEWGDYSRQYPVYDDYGGTSLVTQYGLNYYTARTAYDPDYGYSYNIPASPLFWYKNAIFCTRNPVAVSLAVTP